ncbi:unnamed protein product, partial [Ectocarpus fasciculatus]
DIHPLPDSGGRAGVPDANALLGEHVRLWRLEGEVCGGRCGASAVLLPAPRPVVRHEAHRHVLRRVSAEPRSGKSAGQKQDHPHQEGVRSRCSCRG